MDGKIAEKPDGMEATAVAPDAGMTPVPGSALSAEVLEQLTADIVAALKTVYDPEIPADIYELGLIYRIDIATSNVVQLTNRRGPDGQPTPSPDGKWIAYTGYDSTSDTWVDAKLYLMSSDGTGHRVLLPKWDRTPTDLTWAKDGSGIYFNAESEGARNLYMATLAGDVKPVTTGRQVLTVTSINANGTAVGVMSTATHPTDVVAFNMKSPAAIKWLTNVNDDVLMGKTLGQTDEIWFEAKDTGKHSSGKSKDDGKVIHVR